MIDDRKTTVPSGGTDITAEDIPLGVPVLKGPGFFSGLLSGILLTLVLVFFYVGRWFVPVPYYGTVVITLPTYELFHALPEGSVDLGLVGQKLRVIEGYLEDEYYYKRDPALLTDGMYYGYMAGLTWDDPYAAYFSAESYEETSNDFNNVYIGIGVTVSTDPVTGGLQVLDVTSGGPASEAGLLAGDIILTADGTDLTGMTLDEASANHIKGPEGSSVVLGILRGEEELEITCVRRPVKLRDSVCSTIIRNGDGTKTGYISVEKFNSSTGYEFSSAVMNLSDRKADSLVIDLRDNVGGEVNICLEMLDYLLPDKDTRYSTTEKSLLLSFEEKDSKKEYFYAGDGSEVKLPIVILTDERSASAAEIFTGVMQSYGYKSVGTKTFGKGIFQTVLQLGDGSAIRFTSGEYVLPDGRKIHGTGIAPDVEAAPDETLEAEGFDPENPDPSRDNMLREALNILSEEKNGIR